MVVLTSLIHRGSAESKAGNDRLQAKLDDIDGRLSQPTERDADKSGGRTRRRP
jgi:hypothetical protein